MKILQVCAFGAPNPGNFIASLLALEIRLKAMGIETIYAFAETARNKEWCIEFSQNHRVYFLPVAKARIKPKTYVILRKIYTENDINIVHCHFELYDIPATITAHKNVKIFWHLHDPLPDKITGLRGILTKVQYGVVGKKAILLSVSEYYRQQVVKLGFPNSQTITVLNGISLERIQAVSLKEEKKYTFITFCWDYFRKGTDLILDACEQLYQEGYQFTILLNGNSRTMMHIKEYYNDKIPSYIEVGGSVKDVNILYSSTMAFIQASRRETFSYAVCEAAYAGLPVISSDIAGLEWAHEIPTVLYFKSEDKEELYECMKKIISKEWKPYTDEINCSRKKIREKFSLDVWCEKIIEIYDNFYKD